MRKCYACQEETGDSLYCLHCGALQRCLQCNHEFETDNKFCGECGTKKGEKPNQLHKENVNEKPVQKESPVQKSNTQSNPVQAINKSSTEHVQVEKTSGPSGKGPSTMTLIIGAVVVIVAAAAIYFFMFGNMQKTPEDTVENFIQVVDKQDEKRVEEFFRPSDRKELMEQFDFSDVPKDAEFLLLSIEDIDYESDSLVYVETEMRFSSESEGESDDVYVDFELLKLKNKWYIIDVY